MDTQINGHLAVSGPLTVAGKAAVGSNASVRGNLQVGGWLDAPNVKSPCKGLFPTLEALSLAYPRPRPGWWALVGETLPAMIYRCDRREWEYTGEEGGEPIADLTAYDQALEDLHADITQVQASVNSISVEHPVTVEDTTLGDLVIADEDRNAIVTFKNGHIKTAKFDSSTLQSTSTTTSTTNTTTTTAKPSLPGTWVSLGTSITANEGTSKGYQAYVREKITFGGFENRGVGGSTILNLAAALDTIPNADYYTIEHGLNDFGGGTTMGTLSDFINDTGATTFYGAYRKVIDKIYTLNQSALIMLITPVKGTGPVYSLPSTCYTQINGHTLEDFADAVKSIGKYCSAPVADVFGECSLSVLNHSFGYFADTYLHPNAAGHKRMAAIVYRKFLTFDF